MIHLACLKTMLDQLSSRISSNKCGCSWQQICIIWFFFAKKRNFNLVSIHAKLELTLAQKINTHRHVHFIHDYGIEILLSLVTVGLLLHLFVGSWHHIYSFSIHDSLTKLWLSLGSHSWINHLAKHTQSFSF
jgi:hypothetical protein